MIAPAPFSLALSCNRLVLASLKLVLDACRKRIKVGFRGRSSSFDDFEFVASLLCVTGAALSSNLLEFRGRRSTFELVMLHFVAGAVLWRLGVDFVAGASL